MNTLLVVSEHFSGLADPNRFPSCLKMPHLQALSQEGCRFRRALCSAPVCGPSRMSLLTGLEPHRHGAYDNGSALASHIPTYAHLLSGAGVETVISGRMHIHGLDFYKGFQQRLVTEILNPLPEQPPSLPAQPTPIPPLPEGTMTIPEFSNSPIYRHDEYVTAKAVEYLKGRRHRGGSPFHLTVGYLAAHSGGRPNPAYARWVDEYLIHPDLPVKRFTEEDYERLPENARRLLHLGRRNRDIFSPDYQRRELARYFAALSFLDEQLGLLLKTLNESGLAEETVVCFTSDHGENMGRHGIWGKMNFYEEAVCVPLYFRGPGIPANREIDTPASLCDLLPTLCELAGVEADVPMDGGSLVPFFSDLGETPLVGTERIERTLFAEYHGHLSVCGGYMITTDDWKLVHYPQQEDELYHLKSDPSELRNLAQNPEQKAVYMTLLRRLEEHFDLPCLEERIALYNRQRAAVIQGITASPLTCERLIAETERFRAEWNEPWWDDGSYMEQFEAYLFAHRHKDGKL